jgi:succinoglycan biosynthesis protein ExoM
MTDDDCVPGEGWLVELLMTQQRTQADAISGPLFRRVPSDSPRWLVDQPFLELGLSKYAQDSELAYASTHNSMLSSAWLREHPGHRFEPRLGRLGGEDMFFYRSANREGLRIAYAPGAVVYEDQPPERRTYRYMLRLTLWLGNSSLVTSLDGDQASRPRLVIHGFARIGRAFAYPFQRLRRGRSPQLRYSLALAAGGLGVLLGSIGVRVRHH